MFLIENLQNILTNGRNVKSEIYESFVRATIINILNRKTCFRKHRFICTLIIHDNAVEVKANALPATNFPYFCVWQRFTSVFGINSSLQSHDHKAISEINCS